MRGFGDSNAGLSGTLVHAWSSPETVAHVESPARRPEGLLPFVEVGKRQVEGVGGGVQVQAAAGREGGSEGGRQGGRRGRRECGGVGCVPLRKTGAVVCARAPATSGDGMVGDRWGLQSEELGAWSAAKPERLLGYDLVARLELSMTFSGVLAMLAKP